MAAARRALAEKVRRLANMPTYAELKKIRETPGGVRPSPTAPARRGCVTNVYQSSAGQAAADAIVEGAVGLLDEEEPPWPEEIPDEAPRKAVLGPESFVSGALFVLDAPTAIPAVWGQDGSLVWAEGEAQMLVGPDGVGKTTLAHQLVAGRLGLRRNVLGMSVVSGKGRVRRPPGRDGDPRGVRLRRRAHRRSHGP